MLRICSLLVLLALPVSAQTLTGAAHVIDGDTIDVAGQRVRLHGIDAPELQQSCTRAGREWACGAWAKDVVQQLVGRKTVICHGHDHDRYGRLVATCHVDGADLADTLVHLGAAFAYRRYSLDYIKVEAQASAARRGLWAGEAEAPSAIRTAAWADPTPDTCAIKGNVSASGRIYHMPGQQHYAATRISAAKGERWFCTEAEAAQAGWRPARR